MNDVPRLHAITDDARLADERFVDDAAALLEAGGNDIALHLRGRNTTAARLLELTATLLPIARSHGATILVNDRIDVALVAGADGVQLREDSLDVRTARTLLGPDAAIGVSRHAGSIETDVEGADFVFFGSVFETASHADRTPAGIEALRNAAAVLARRAPDRSIPLVAIGGMTPERVAAVVGAGARGVAALSGVWVQGRVHEYLTALGRGTPAGG